MLARIHIVVPSVINTEHPLVGTGEGVLEGVSSRWGLRGVGTTGEGSKIQSLISSSTDRVWTVVSTDLDHTLEVNVHRVGELERLEVGVTDYRGRGAKVLDLLELGHDLGPGDAAQLVHQLDGGPLAVVSHTVADKHVELVLVILGNN